MTELEIVRVSVNTLWVTFSAALVFFMSIGFALLESGLCQSKNHINVLTKNLAVYGISVLAYWMIGFGLEFANGNDFVGQGGFLLLGEDNSPAIKTYSGIYSSLSWAGVPLATKFVFQVGFAATTAMIVSGAIAERIKLINYLLFCLLFVGLIYPVVGHWVWGGGWLSKAGFFDFAGSCVVHVAGGCAALSGAFILGPRKDRYLTPKHPFVAHSYTNAVMGAGVLWLGWWGFNGGSTMSATTYSAIGAIPVHLVFGAWGTLALGLFSQGSIYTSPAPRIGILMGGSSYQLGIQLVGMLSVTLFVTLTSVILWLGLKSLLGLRVNPKSEHVGLDLSVHGIEDDE
jgi:ammonium transporter, Amt family